MRTGAIVRFATLGRSGLHCDWSSALLQALPSRQIRAAWCERESEAY
jgi:hypothetical protein